jgi:hypothetical protein
MAMTDQPGPRELLDRLLRAQNDHDIDSFVACFASGYRSAQPVHPDRTFVGREQVRTNWSSVFEGVPDFRAELIRTAVQDGTVWSEWQWTGTRADGGHLDDRGVIILGVARGEIEWARLYIEPVEEQGGGITAAVDRMRGADAS